MTLVTCADVWLLASACRNAALSGLTHDIHADVEGNDKIQEMHDDAEKFDPRTEEVFKVRYKCVTNTVTTGLQH